VWCMYMCVWVVFMRVCVCMCIKVVLFSSECCYRTIDGRK
jgi:hypothetical protein